MSKKRNLVQELLDRNCLLTPDCYEILEDLDDDTLDIDRLAEALKDEFVVTAEKLQEALVTFEELLSEGSIQEMDEEMHPHNLLISKKSKQEEKPKIDSSVETKIKQANLKSSIGENFKPIGKEVKTQIKILQESTRNTSIEGDIKDFNKYFISRYNQMSKILKKRGDIPGGVRIKDLEKIKLESNEKVTIIGMVTEKRTLKNGGMLLEIEDPSGNLVTTILPNKEELIIKAGSLLEDQVAGFFGSFYENRFFIDDFVFPDIPMLSSTKKIADNISVCMTSDLHIGSKEFLEDSFNNFIDFLNGRIDDPYQQTLAEQIKYLIINGDLVEGIGIYPKQEEDLIITDIYDQYKHAAEILAKVPKWIHIIIVSGNHDACRLALPQPAIGKEYASKLWEMENVTLLSNPSTVNIHGKIFLIYHGNSFEDVSSLTPGLSMNDPNGPMIHTLRFRHVAPTFGRRSSIVPSLKDELVIEHVPDVYHTGHIHINSNTHYRGVECINSGTFQSQTDYMLSKNIIPTPGRVPIINLQTNKLHQLVFYDPTEVSQ
ncbi:MAG: DNA-directed DNA polymerase II small subunit [Asgard group archaeon]|nr:DNA-directed DNA polymerase II small subunit [Asgard group archaeon]